MKYDSYKDIPNDVLEGLIELYSRKAPPPNIAEAITETKLMHFNFAAGRHSILTELRDEQEQRRRKAVKSA